MPPKNRILFRIYNAKSRKGWEATANQAGRGNAAARRHFWCSIGSYVKPALKGEVDMSVSEWTEGLKKKEASLIYVNPSVNPPYGVLPAPRKGEPFGALYKLT